MSDFKVGQKVKCKTGLNGTVVQVRENILLIEIIDSYSKKPVVIKKKKRQVFSD